MELNKQVPSLELCKRLKELGYKQEGLFWWVNQPNGGLNTNGYKWQLEGEPRTRIPQYDYIVAPTVSEMGEIIPAYFVINIFRTMNDGWGANLNWIEQIPVYAETEADLRAKMLIYLLENKLISLKRNAKS